jgi:hypothetical protein
MKTRPGVDEIWAVYMERWQQRIGKGPPPILTRKRRLQIESRLGEFGMDRLIEAVHAMWNTSWRISRGYTLPEYVFRSTEQVELVLSTEQPAPKAKGAAPVGTGPAVVDEPGEADGAKMLQRVLPEFGYVASLDPKPNSSIASLGSATFEPTPKGARMVLTVDFRSEAKLRKCLVELEKIGVLR